MMIKKNVTMLDKFIGSRTQAEGKVYKLLRILLMFALVWNPQVCKQVKAEQESGSLAPRAPQKNLELEAGSAEIIMLPMGVSDIFVSNNKVADIQLSSPQVLYVYGITSGETTVFASTENGENVLNLSVTVTPNLSKLREMISSMAPEAKIDIAGENYNILLTGTVPSSKTAADITNLASRFISGNGMVINRMNIDTPTQVSIRVMVAEVSRTAQNDLGINWDLMSRAGVMAFGLGLGRHIQDLASGLPLGGLNVIGGTPTVSTTSIEAMRAADGSNGIYLGYRRKDGLVNIGSLIEALASEGYASLLAEPNLTVLSGQTATFNSGGEFPVSTSQGNNTNTTTYKPYGVMLNATATVLSDNLMELDIHVEVSTIDRPNSAGNYVVSTRRAGSTLQLASGQSIVLAGLIQSNISSVISGVPGLSELPGFLGALFRSTKFLRRETEVVFVVTPYLVKPTNMKMSRPYEKMRYANQIDRLFNGRIFAESTEGSEHTRRPSLMGTAGFMMD